MNRVPKGSNSVSSSHRLSRRAKWDLAVAIWGLAYVTLVLTLNLSSPLLSVVFVAVAGYELFAGRVR
jgi:hypothetical protein